MRDKLGLVEAMLTRDAPAWMTTGAASALTGYLAVLIRWGAMLPDDPALRLRLGDFPELHRRIAAFQSRPAAQRLAAAEDLGPTPFTDPQG
jgi:glutathione S-transferase